MPIQTPPPPQKSKWPQYLLMACVAIALGIAFYILYTRYIRKKKNNSSNNSSNRGNNTSARGSNARTNANTNTAATAGLNEDFGDDFGDFDTTPPATTATR